MQLKNILALFIVLSIIAACNNHQPAADKDEKASIEQTTVSSIDSTAETTPAEQFKHIVFDSKKDFVCGMPTSAGVTDTAHYKNKVYGFCSKECKDEFVKNPTAYIHTN